jgi:archaellum component FlaC
VESRRRRSAGPSLTAQVLSAANGSSEPGGTVKGSQAVVDAITVLTSEVHRVNDRLDQMDNRFDRMDDRFDRMDDRFDQIERRLDHIDTRIDSVHTRIDSVNDSMRLVGESLVRHMQEGH